jgi:pimeloyl-ACP methyl ester carboxylesterase
VLRGWTCGSGPPLYFVNGFAGSSALYCLTAWLLRDHARCVFFDVEPTNRAEPSSLGDFCTDLLEAASLNGDHSFAVFGTTFGGTVALQTAVLAPERVERLMLQSVPARSSLTWAERWLAKASVWSRAPLARFPGRLRVQTFNHRRWFPPLDPDRWQCFLEMTGGHPVALAARQALALAAVDLRPQLGQIHQPVLLIDTEGAGLRLSAAQQEVRQGLPNVQEERLHTTGLYPYLTHPHRLVKLIQAWWEFAKPQAIDVSGFAIPQEETA